MGLDRSGADGMTERRGREGVEWNGGRNVEEQESERREKDVEGSLKRWGGEWQRGRYELRILFD